MIDTSEYYDEDHGVGSETPWFLLDTGCHPFMLRMKQVSHGGKSAAASSGFPYSNYRFPLLKPIVRVVQNTVIFKIGQHLPQQGWNLDVQRVFEEVGVGLTGTYEVPNTYLNT